MQWFKHDSSNLIFNNNKFALLWGEAQLGLPYVCLEKKIAYGYPKKVTYSDPKVTHIDPTHLPLPPPTSPCHCLAISQVKINLWVVVVGGGGWQPTLM